MLHLELAVVEEKPSSEEVLNHLAFFGAPLRFNPSMEPHLNLEETLKWALKYSLNDGLLESVVDLILMKIPRNGPHCW